MFLVNISLFHPDCCLLGSEYIGLLSRATTNIICITRPFDKDPLCSPELVVFIKFTQSIIITIFVISSFPSCLGDYRQLIQRSGRKTCNRPRA